MTILYSQVYCASDLTRVKYQAVVSAITEAEGWTKSTVSLAVTVLFIAYGRGQFLSGAPVVFRHRHMGTGGGCLRRVLRCDRRKMAEGIHEIKRTNL